MLFESQGGCTHSVLLSFCRGSRARRRGRSSDAARHGRSRVIIRRGFEGHPSRVLPRSRGHEKETSVQQKKAPRRFDGAHSPELTISRVQRRRRPITARSRRRHARRTLGRDLVYCARAEHVLERFVHMSSSPFITSRYPPRGRPGGPEKSYLHLIFFIFLNGTLFII